MPAEASGRAFFLQPLGGRPVGLALDDEELRCRMGAAGLERVKTELAWEHEAPRLLAAYDELFK